MFFVAILGLILMGLAVFCVLGALLLIAGVILKTLKKRHRGLLISGIALCAPLAVYYLLGAVGALAGFIGDKL